MLVLSAAPVLYTNLCALSIVEYVIAALQDMTIIVLGFRIVLVGIHIMVYFDLYLLPLLLLCLLINYFFFV